MVTILLNGLYGFLTFLIGLFPTGTGFPTAFHTAVTNLGGYLHILDPLVPISTLLTCLTLVFTVEIAIFGFKTFKWIFGHVPLIGGKGK